MIDLNLYRSRIGLYRGARGNVKSCAGNVSTVGNCKADDDFLSISFLMFYLTIYLYFAICVLGSIVSMLGECSFRSFTINRFYAVSDTELLYSHTLHNKLLSAILIYFLVKRDILAFRFFGFFLGILNKLMFCGVRTKGSSQSSSRARFVLDNLKVLCSGLLVWTVSINSVLIVLVNPSILNPGPRSLNSISITSFNVQGLIPFSQLSEDHPTLDVCKLHELNYYLNDSKPDILMLNETWLKRSVLSSEIFPDSYKIFRLDRSPKTHPPDLNNPKKFRKFGGGVLIAIRQDLDVVSTKLEFTCSAEMLGITLKFRDGKKIILCSFYRVGTLGVDNHREFCEYVNKARRRRGVCGIIVAGDLNFPDINWSNFSSTKSIDQQYLDSFSNFGLEQLVNCPTHTRGNLLDVVLTDKSQLISGLNVSDIKKPCKSDHYTVNFRLKTKVKRIKLVKRDAYNYNRADWGALNSSLGDVDWEQELVGGVENSWSTFKNILFSKLDDHVPKIKIGGKIQPPWFDAEVHHMCRKKERLHSEYKHAEDPVIKTNRYLKFSSCRKEYKNLVSKKLGDSFEDSDDTNCITKKFWSYVKATSNNTRIPEMVQFNDVFKTEASDQAELFNCYFQQQFSEPSSYDISIDSSDLDDWHIDFSPGRLVTILKNLKPNKAMGPDNIHGKVLKNCSRTLAPALSILYKMSYSSGLLPSEWKLANVVPVHKKGSKTDVQNYRPISLTSLVVKVMERIIRDELMLKCGDLIDHRQHGFLPEKSCCTQLTQFCDSLSLSLNKNIKSDIVYFDFAKAFDSVNHDLILHKLKHTFRIDGIFLAFIKNYLSDRWQSVVVHGSTSSRLRVLSGVPQGSILGPSLFVLFINDISNGLSPGTNIMLYADDTKIWREMNCEEDYDTIQRDINYLLDWAVRNKMKFHPAKCKVLSVSNPNSHSPLLGILPCIQYSYSMGSAVLDYTESEKDLGIHINPTLNFNEQALFLYAKANQKLGMLKRNCYFVNDIKKRKVLYLTLVRSIFEHCPTIWRPRSKTMIEKLENLQKRAIKWIKNETSTSYSIEDLYYLHCKELDILPIRVRFDYHDLKTLHQIIHGFSCISLPEYLKLYTGSSRLRSSHLDDLCLISDVIPRGTNASNSRNAFSNSFFYRAHLLWNRLPKCLREIIGPGVFKTRLKQYLWENAVFIGEDDSFSSEDGN